MHIAEKIVSGPVSNFRGSQKWKSP